MTDATRTTEPQQLAAPASFEPGGPPRLRALLMLMCVALALVVGATSSLAVAQPDIARALGASQTQLTWVINAYALAFAALLLPAGIATDKYGRRTALTIGLLVFGGASLLSGFSAQPAMLIALRVVAGVGATLVMPATLSVLVDAFPAQRRSFAVAVWAGVTGAGALIGVLLSGVLLHWFWWGSIQVLYGAAGLLLVPLVIGLVPNLRNGELRLDPPGAILSAVGLGAVVYGVIEGPDRGWTDPLTLAALGFGMMALVGFVLVELRRAHPMLDVRLFTSPGLATGSFLVLLLSLAVFGFFLIGPQYLQVVRGYDSLGAAVRLLPFAIGIGPTSQLSPRLTARFGARWTGAVGAATMGAGLALFALTATGSYWQFALSLIVTSAGMGLALTAGTVLILDGLPADRRTLASAVNDVTREVGGAVGIAALGSVLVSIYHQHVAAALPGLPPGIAAAVRSGITGALTAAPHAGAAGPHLVAAARNAFTDGYREAMLLGAAVLLVTALLTTLIAPAHLRLSADPS